MKRENCEKKKNKILEEAKKETGNNFRSSIELSKNEIQTTINRKTDITRFTYNDYDMSDPESVVGNEEQKMNNPLASKELRVRRMTEYYSKKNANT